MSSLYKAFTREEIAELVFQHIDQRGVNGLSAEETELIKPFFLDLFEHFHEGAQTTTLTECTRNDYHNLTDPDSQPVFVTGSGRVFCSYCALVYIIDNLSDWHYYLGDIASGIGYVPPSIQNKGLALQKEIDEQRQSQQ